MAEYFYTLACSSPPPPTPPTPPLPAPLPQTPSSLMVIDSPRDGGIISRAMKSDRPNVPDTLGAVRLPVRVAASSPLGPRHTGFRGQSAACLSHRRLLSCLVPGTLVLPFFLLSCSGSLVLSFLLLSSPEVLPFFLLSCLVPEVLFAPFPLVLSSSGGLVLLFFLLSCPVPEVLSCPSFSCLVQFRTSCLASPCLVLCCSVAAASCGDEDRVLSAVELTGCWEF